MRNELKIQERMELLESDFQRLDEVEALVIARLPPVEMPVKHHFTPGLYIRSIFIPANTMVTSRIHKTEHPFIMIAGSAFVWSPQTGWKFIKAPHAGITVPGTKRFIQTLEDVIWVTFHPTDKTDVAEIANDILFDRENPLLDEAARQRLVDVTK